MGHGFFSYMLDMLDYQRVQETIAFLLVSWCFLQIFPETKFDEVTIQHDDPVSMGLWGWKTHDALSELFFFLIVVVGV